AVVSYLCFILLLIWGPPRLTLFPYTTLFRSPDVRERGARRGHAVRELGADHQKREVVEADGRRCRRVPEGLHRRHAQRDEQRPRSEEHTSELQSRENIVCRLLLEKKKTGRHK